MPRDEELLLHGRDSERLPLCDLHGRGSIVIDVSGLKDLVSELIENTANLTRHCRLVTQSSERYLDLQVVLTLKEK